MNLFSYLKTRVTILDVVSEYATLKKAGLYYKGQCPFHSEKTASFTVSPHKEIFYCFGCHVGGDVIAFIAKIEQCSQSDAAKHLIDRYNIELPTTLSAQVNLSPNTDKHYFHICQVITDWCNQQLLKSAEPFSYLSKRGITKESIQDFKIGFMPGGLTNIKKFITDLNKEQILVDDLLEWHILSRAKNILFSPYEDRIIFPISDHLGRYCGFGGRIFKPQDTRPKYYNSHENDHFAKGQLVFGLDKAKKDIQKTGKVFLVEGYTDCIAMAQSGFTNSVATLGTACTIDHLNVLGRYAQELYVLYDGDNAGQQAILRIGQLCWQASIDLKVVSLPKDQDPASFLLSNNDLNPLIQEAQDIFQFFIKTMATGFGQKSLSEKLEVSRKIVTMIQKLNDPLKQDILLENASNALKIPVDSLKKELARLSAPSLVSSPVKAQSRVQLNPTAFSSQTATMLENKIFFAILNNIQLVNKENEEFLVTYLPQPFCAIIKKLQEEKNRVPNLGFIQFFESLNEFDQQRVSKILLESQEDIQTGHFEQLVVQLQKKHWKVIVNNIKIKLEAAKQADDQAQIALIMQNLMDLQKKIIGNNIT